MYAQMKKLAKLSLRTLTLEKLTKVTGGEAASTDHEVVSPRDAASGLPTGKRM